MVLCEIDPEHEFDDYKLFPFHSIRSGVIISGYDAYVFTPISKRDIISYLKCVIQGNNNNKGLLQSMKFVK